MTLKELLERLTKHDDLDNDQVVVRLENIYDTDSDEDLFIPVADVKCGDDAEMGGVELILEAKVVPSVNYVPKAEYISSYDTETPTQDDDK